jgi:hypothetical protein
VSTKKSIIARKLKEADEERIKTLETNSTNAMMYWKGKLDAYQEVIDLYER